MSLSLFLCFCISNKSIAGFVKLHLICSAEKLILTTKNTIMKNDAIVSFQAVAS